jgi:hypothetical protein
MLAKRTSKNQLTLPKAIASEFPDAEYFDVQTDGERIVLTPVRLHQAAAVRRKLADLGVREADVVKAIQWARRKG